MFKLPVFVVTILCASVGISQAACPPIVPGDTPEAIRANGQRIVCLQNEVAAESSQRQFEMQLDALERSHQNMLIQRRIDALPRVPVYMPPPMPVPPGQ